MKRIWTVLTALLLSLAFALPVMAESQDMWAYVYRDTGNVGADGKAILERITSGVTFKVLAIDSNTAETTTYYQGSTSLTNPVTTTSFNSATICNDMVSFRVDPTDATNDRYVDLIVVDTTGGYTKFVENFDKYTHAIVIDERPNVVHQGTIWYVFNTGGTATATGITFTPKTAILDVWVEQITIDNGETLEVGTEDTASGFRSAVALTTGAEGFTADTGVITGGSTLDYYAATNYGTLLTTAITGSDGTATGGGNSRKIHFVNTAGTDDNLYYTPSSSDTAAGYIHYMFIRLR